VNPDALGPSAGRAAVWSALGLGACGLAVWALVDSDGHGLAWALLVACVTVTVPFLAQLLVPGRFTWDMGEHALVVRSPLRELVVPWEQVHLARVVRQAGEPALELQVTVDDAIETRLVLLPVGADVALLHRQLRRHLGAMGPDGRDPAPNPGQ
jgi:hypothetical protein